MIKFICHKFFVTGTNRRIFTGRAVSLADIYSTIQKLDSSISLIKQYIANDPSVDGTEVRKLPTVLAEELGYNIFPIVDSMGVNGVNEDVIEEINTKYRSRILDLGHNNELYLKLKAPKRNPNAFNELLDEFEEAKRVCDDIYLTVMRNFKIDVTVQFGDEYATQHI